MNKRDMRDVDGNRQAGLILKRLRELAGGRTRNRYKALTQPKFALALEQVMGSSVTRNQISDWEGAEVTVPAAPLLAALLRFDPETAERLGLTIPRPSVNGSNGAREHKTISILRCEPRRLAA